MDKLLPCPYCGAEATINMDSPMECYPDECNDGCAYMPDCVSKKILDALQILQGKVIVDEERLEKILKNVQCKIRWHECPMLHNGSCTRKETEESCIKRLKAYLTKEDSDER